VLGAWRTAAQLGGRLSGHAFLAGEALGRFGFRCLAPRQLLGALTGGCLLRALFCLALFCKLPGALLFGELLTSQLLGAALLGQLLGTLLFHESLAGHFFFGAALFS